MSRTSYIRLPGLGVTSIVLLLLLSASHFPCSAQRGSTNPGVPRYLMAVGDVSASRGDIALSSISAGQNAGLIVDFLGGLSADIMKQKYPAGALNESISIEFSSDPTGEIAKWVSESFKGSTATRDMSIVSLDYNGALQGGMGLSKANLTSIEFPQLDASSKSLVKFGITARSEKVHYMPSSGKSMAGKKSKSLMAANYRLNIDGVKDADRYVRKVEAIAVTRSGGPESAFTYSELRFEIATAHSDELQQWLIAVSQGKQVKRDGTLEYLSPTLKDVYGTVSFRELEILSITPQAAGSGTIAFSQVRLKIGGLKFTM